MWNPHIKQNKVFHEVFLNRGLSVITALKTNSYIKNPKNKSKKNHSEIKLNIFSFLLKDGLYIFTGCAMFEVVSLFDQVFSEVGRCGAGWLVRWDIASSRGWGVSEVVAWRVTPLKWLVKGVTSHFIARAKLLRGLTLGLTNHALSKWDAPRSRDTGKTIGWFRRVK